MSVPLCVAKPFSARGNLPGDRDTPGWEDGSPAGGDADHPASTAVPHPWSLLQDIPLGWLQLIWRVDSAR